MKNLFKTSLKLTLICILFALAGCEKDLYEENIKSERGKISHVTINDVPFLIPTIQKYNKDYGYLSNSNKSSNKEFLNLNLDLENIIKYEEADGKESYSIVVKKEFEEFENTFFENLHIYEREDDYKSVILRYDSLDDYKKFDMKTFTGSIEVYDINQNYQGVVQVSAGKLDCVKITIGCWYIVIMSDGNIGVSNECSTGGGGSDTGSSDSGGGSDSDGGYSGDGSNYGGAPGSPGSNNGGTTPTGNDPTTVEHTPVVPNVPVWPDPKEASTFNMARLLRIELYLTVEEQLWLRDNPQITHDIYSYLWDAFHDDSPENDVVSKNIAKNSIAIKRELKTNPNFLLQIPCAEIPKWQSLVQFHPPQSVKDKIQTLDSQSMFTDYNIQTLDHASGAAINLDYFPVTINTLPINPNTGQQFSPTQFLNYVRLNMNSFVDTSFCSFNPTTLSTGYNESQIWDSSNPLGAIIHLDIPLPAGDGSVICSETNSDHWIFTTIEVPWLPSVQNYDGQHPVSGNREFGLIHNANGTYTFYTRGVDRVTDSFESTWAENITINYFENPDSLWNSLKTKVFNFVQNNSGSAVPPTSSQNAIWRPDWVKVRQVLRGEVSISDLGCN